MLYVIPIEPLEERYSAQWLRWTLEWLDHHRTEHVIVNPAAYTTISNGSFLDVVGTNLYKNDQMRMLLKLFETGSIKDGDIFWFHDMWFPGLEMLAYIRDALGIKIKIYGCLHAGTYDPHDFLTKKGMRSWGKYTESAWFNIVDGIFVATNYHKKLIKKNSTGVSSKRIHVTGFPMYARTFALPQNAYDERDKIIVFPHRLDSEKQPDLFDEFKQELLEKCLWSRDYTFIKTKDVCRTKEEYYALLRRARYAVSFALQETWGIAIQEAVLCGCIPIVPNRLSYSEMYSDAFKYDGSRPFSDAVLAAQCLDYIQQQQSGRAEVYADIDQCDLRHRGEAAFSNMMRIMGVI